MKHILRLVLVVWIFLAGTFTSCDEKEGVPIDLLTITADALYYPSGSENWVVVWNSQGEVLDYKPYSLGETLKLSSTGNIIDNKIAVGFLSIGVFSGRKNCIGAVFTDIERGATFTRKNVVSNAGSPGSTTNFTVNLASPEPDRFVFVTNKFGFNAGGGNDTDSYNCFLDSRPADYNVIYRTETQGVRHKVLTGVKTADVFNLTDSDFTLYANQVTYTFPPAVPVLFVNGLGSDVATTAPGYIMDFYIAGTPKTSITTGYFDSISKFNFYLLLRFAPDSHDIVLEKIGALPIQPAWPDQTKFSVTNKEINAFSLAALQNVVFTKSVWEYSSAQYATQWTISSPSLAPKIGKLPDEILAAHPEYNVTANDFQTATFYLGPQTYDQFLKTELEQSLMDGMERMSVTVRK